MNIDSGQTWFCIFVPTHDISWFSATFSRQFFDGPSLYFNISKIFKISIFLIFLTFANCIIRMSDEYKSPSDSKIQLMLILTLTPGRNDRYSYQGQSKNQSLVRNYNLVSHLPKMIGSKFFLVKLGFRNVSITVAQCYQVHPTVRNELLVINYWLTFHQPYRVMNSRLWLLQT